jgi:sortase A
MKPNEPSSNQSGDPLLSQGSASVTAESHSEREAAAKIIRSQIDNMFSAEEASPSPYQRTHVEHVDPQSEQWKEYHTAWQNYYQKYYEGYYVHNLKQARHSFEEQIAISKRSNPNNQPTNIIASHKEIPTEEAIFDLRQKLVGKVKESASKIHKSRHFIPIISGVAVVLILLFLQYNRLVISNVIAYVSPGNIDPQNIVIDPSTAVQVSADPKLIIPKINVDAPVFYDIGNDYNSQMAAMAKGVAQFAIPGASSHPGQIGNTVIAGHSSNDLFDTGDYKFIFAQLDKLDVGDTIYANYNSIRYTYAVTSKVVVKPTDVSKLVYSTNVPILTLLTCTPVGTSLNRLLVIADQISPDPSQSTSAPAATNTKSTSLPGNSPTLLERLFGGGN